MKELGHFADGVRGGGNCIYMIAGDRASRSYRTTRLTSQSQSRQERRGCEACNPHRPENRGRSHLKVAGWLARAFCKPCSTSLKPKKWFEQIWENLGKTNKETFENQWKYQKKFRKPQPSNQKVVCRTLVQTIFKMSSDRGEACTKGGSDNRMSRALC